MFEYRPSLGRRVRGLCIPENPGGISSQPARIAVEQERGKVPRRQVHTNRTRAIRIYAAWEGWGLGVQVLKPLEKELIP